MNKIWTKSEVLTQYINSGIVMKKATLEGDYKTNNKEGKKITELFKYLEKNLILANESLPLLLSHENVVIRTKAAAHCLALRINITEAEKALVEIAEDGSNGIYGFNAEMTLKVWSENGHLQVY
jgi:hypothetical protein